jgi:hypothetical protein
MKHFGMHSRLFEEASGDGGGTGAFDAAAFQASLMVEVTKAITAAQTASDKKFKTEMAKFTPRATDDAAAAQAAADAAAASAATDAAAAVARRDPAYAALERSNKDFAARFKALEEKNAATEELNKKTNAQAEEKERHAAIRASLGDFQFASDDAREDAFRALRDEVKRGEDGELYGGDFVPAKDFIKARMATKTHLLAPKQIDSSGARQNTGMPGGRQVQVEDIKPGMDTKTRDAAWAAVQAAAASLR